jgi:hypothetical protein
MTVKPFLHELPDMAQLYAIAAARIGTHPQVVEKDYWLMHCLWSLKAQGFVFELKGGTSLSKGFDVIYRFSEDIDIHIHAPAEVKTGRNQDKPAHVESRRRFFDELAGKITIPGIAAVERDRDFDDEKMRSAGIRLTYLSRYEALPELKPSILLEAGFDLTYPHEPRTISSWSYDQGAAAGIEVVDNRAQSIPCYLPEYTFVEKLQTISTKFRQEQQGETSPANFIRHYYDVYQLLNLGRVQDFIGTAKYLAHKESRFRTLDQKDLTKNEAFRLRDSKTRARYVKEYQRTAAIYYRQQPSFEAILSRLAEFLPRL